MKFLYCLLIVTLTFLFISCDNTFTVSETIGIKTTRDSIDIDYQNLIKVVQKLNRQQIQERIFEKRSDIIKHFVERVKVKSVKKTESIRKEINNEKTNSESNVIFVEIEMNYNKSKSDQAIHIIKDYKALVRDELIKCNINIEPS